MTNWSKVSLGLPSGSAAAGSSRAWLAAGLLLPERGDRCAVSLRGDDLHADYRPPSASSTAGRRSPARSGPGSSGRSSSAPPRRLARPLISTARSGSSHRRNVGSSTTRASCDRTSDHMCSSSSLGAAPIGSSPRRNDGDYSEEGPSRARCGDYNQRLAEGAAAARNGRENPTRRAGPILGRRRRAHARR